MDLTEEPLISVIIATYKSANTIGRLLDSLLEQSYKNLEILLIDDCSPDQTVEVLKAYSHKDPRVKVHVLEENSGTPSAGRNYGLELAKGEYVTFCDHDDILINQEAIKRLWQDLQAFSADTSSYSFTRLQAQTKRLDDAKLFALEEKKYTSFLQAQGELNYNILTWARLYKLSIIKEHNIRFPVGLVFEDCLFSRHYMLFAKNGLTYTRKPYYCWVESPSLSNLSKKIACYSRDFFTYYEQLYALYDSCGYKELVYRALFIDTYHSFHSFAALDLCFFRKAKVFFNKHWSRAPQQLYYKQKLVWYLCRHSSVLAYLYFVLIKDRILRHSLGMYRRTYAGKATGYLVLACGNLVLKTLELALAVKGYAKAALSRG